MILLDKAIEENRKRHARCDYASSVLHRLRLKVFVYQDAGPETSVKAGNLAKRCMAVLKGAGRK